MTPEKPRAIKSPTAVWDGEFWRDGEYWYKEASADAAVAFFAQHLVLTEGEWAGRPFILEDWQEHDIVRPLFGWKRPDGTRRYRRCFVWVPRKNGKTELAAGLALLMLLGDGEPGGQVFAIASEKDQAEIVFSKASKMVERSATLQLPDPDGAGLETYRDSIFWPKETASFRPLSGKAGGKHGLNMSGLIGDEVHEWKNGDLYTFVHDSAAARRQPLEVLISTAGVKGSHGEEIWSECEALLTGDVEDPATMVVVYAAAPEDDWKDPAVWRKANPNFGKSVKEDVFLEDFNRAKQLKRLEGDFKRYRLNMWTDQAVQWLPLDDEDDEGRKYGWDHCVGPRVWRAPDGSRPLEDFLRGKRCFGGLDLSAVNDLSALVWYFPVQDGLPVPVLLPRFFKPKDLIKAHAKRDKLPYERWVQQGAIEATPGNVVDYEFIRARILADGEMFNIAHAGSSDVKDGEGSIAIDRWNAVETTVKLRQEGLAAVLFGQGYISMSDPSKQLERLVLANGVHHGGHPVLREHVKVAAIEGDAAGNIKPSKSGSKKRIDGVVGSVMAIGIAAHDKGPTKKSFWETLGDGEQEAA